MWSLRAFLVDLARSGAGEDPENYRQAGQLGLQELDALEPTIERLRGALEDIASADTTSALKGAVAIAKRALEEQRD